jgi:feruloyl-CoA synthase
LDVIHGMTDSQQHWRHAPVRPNDLPPMDLRVRREADGHIWLTHGMPLEPFAALFIHHISQQALAQPDKTAYARREPGGAAAGAAWDRLSYGELEVRVRRVAGWFTEQDARGEVLLLLTGNSIDHAVVRLGAIAAGVVVCPVSAAYLTAGGDFGRLAYVRDLVQPRYLFADVAATVLGAASIFAQGDYTLLSSDLAGSDGLPIRTIDLHHLEQSSPLEGSGDGDPDAPCAYMLTSGSTGRPKAVIQTQRMILSNLHQARQILGQAAGWSEYMLDWLPWSHVSGAFNLYAAATFGGSLYIDDGKPALGLFAETIANLREAPLTYFCNVPLGYGMLVDALRDDSKLRQVFFEKLRLMLYGGAGLSQPVMDALQGMAVAETGSRIMMTTGYGLTESASGCMAIYFPTDKVGIGLPMPGVETRLVPLGDARYEIRLRGPNVMQGYLNNPQATAGAFDEDGCFRTGDAARFHDESDPEQGLAYAGRLVEEFKLSSGTWVRAGAVRAEILAAFSPAFSDLLLCGVNEAFLAALVVPNIAGLQTLSGLDSTDPTVLAAHPSVRAKLEQCLRNYNGANPGRSSALRRLAFMQSPPDPQRHEISDKGTINQRIAADNRSDEIANLFKDAPGKQVIVAST